MGYNSVFAFFDVQEASKTQLDLGFLLCQFLLENTSLCDEGVHKKTEQVIGGAYHILNRPIASILSLRYPSLRKTNYIYGLFCKFARK
jgi:hypothetical protein